MSDVVELLSDALLGPRPIVQQSHQSLFLGELEATGSDIITRLATIILNILRERETCFIVL